MIGEALRKIGGSCAFLEGSGKVVWEHLDKEGKDGPRMKGILVTRCRLTHHTPGRAIEVLIALLIDHRQVFLWECRFLQNTCIVDVIFRKRS